MRFGISGSSPLFAGLAMLLAKHCLNSRDLAAHHAHAIRILELTIRALEAQIELLLLQLHERVGQFISGLHAEI
jgi:hypothetical protein